MFSCGFCEISKNTFFTEHVRATVSGNFAKDHCFITLSTLNYVDCTHFFCIDSFHKAPNQAKEFKKILISNLRKT